MYQTADFFLPFIFHLPYADIFSATQHQGCHFKSAKKILTTFSKKSYLFFFNSVNQIFVVVTRVKHTLHWCDIKRSKSGNKLQHLCRVSTAEEQTCDLCVKLSSSSVIITVQTHTKALNTHTHSAPEKSPPTAFSAKPILADCSPNHHQGEVAGFSKCSVFQPWPSGPLLLVGRGA